MLRAWSQKTIKRIIWRYLKPSLENFSASKAARSISPISGLLLNWKGSEKVFDFLVSQIDQKEPEVHLNNEGPEVKEVKPPYFSKFSGAFSESSNSVEIKWKVKKYEAQILELRSGLKQHFEGQKPDSHEEEIALFAGTFHPEQELIEILEKVKIDLSDHNRFNQNYLSEVRSIYNKHFLPKLRELLLENPENAALQEVCEILYTSVHLENECMDAVALFDQLGAGLLGEQLEFIDPESHGVNPFVKRIHTLYKRIDAAPLSAKAPLLNQWGNSARGQWNHDFDPNRQGNPIYVLYQMYFGDKLIKALGMGSPTIEDKNSKVTFAPEFTGLIKAYKKEGKKHLFVLNQNAVPKNDLLSVFINGDETNRCNLILNGQDLEEFKGAFYCVLLSKNTNFYHQKGSFTALDSAEAFKDELYGQVFLKPRTESGCYIPQTIKEELPDLMEGAKVLTDLIHEHIFQGKESLSSQERKLFIEIFYDLLTKLIIIGLDIDSFNLTCKDAIDRGAGSNAELYLHSAIVLSEKGELSPMTKNKLEVLMMARALLVRKRAPIEERVERFAESLDFALAHAEEFKTLHQSVFQDLHIIPL